jgi:hypothetical protein
MKRSTKIRICYRGAPVLSTLPRCRCLARPSSVPPGSSAVTGADRLMLAQAASRPAGPAGAGLPAQGRDVRRAGGRVRGGHRHRLAVRHRDGGLAGGPFPQLHRALAKAVKAGHAFVVLDGTLIPIDRVAADRPFYSGKHHRHGMNLQVIVSPGGQILWVSGPLPGAVHDLTAVTRRAPSFSVTRCRTPPDSCPNAAPASCRSRGRYWRARRLQATRSGITGWERKWSATAARPGPASDRESHSESQRGPASGDSQPH